LALLFSYDWYKIGSPPNRQTFQARCDAIRDLKAVMTQLPFGADSGR
jgi:hypothetical protein